MFQAKIAMGAAAAAMLILSTLGAASASAGWFISGTELKTSAALSTAEVVDEIPIILVPAIKIAMVCSGGTLIDTNAEIIASSTLEAKGFALLGCNITEPENGCSLQERNATITTVPMMAKLSLGPGESDKIVYSAQTKNTITNVNMSEVNECAFTGSQPIDGSFVENVPKGQLEGIAETIVGLGTVENNSLRVDGDNIYIDGGKALIKLASGSKWSFR